MTTRVEHFKYPRTISGHGEVCSSILFGVGGGSSASVGGLVRVADVGNPVLKGVELCGVRVIDVDSYVHAHTLRTFPKTLRRTKSSCHVDGKSSVRSDRGDSILPLRLKGSPIRGMDGT